MPPEQPTCQTRTTTISQPIIGQECFAQATDSPITATQREQQCVYGEVQHARPYHEDEIAEETDHERNTVAGANRGVVLGPLVCRILRENEKEKSIKHQKSIHVNLYQEQSSPIYKQKQAKASKRGKTTHDNRQRMGSIPRPRLLRSQTRPSHSQSPHYVASKTC